MKKVLFLNPPSNDVVIRDYFCSKVSQASYVNPPVDFVMLSGRLAERFDVRLVDAVVDKLSPSRCRARIRELEPDVIVALTGFVTWKADTVFFGSLDGAPLVLIGDIFLEGAEERLGNSDFADAFLLDFTCDSLVRYIDGEREGLTGMVWRGADGGIVSAPADDSIKEFSIPVPRHELFLRLDYRYPFVMGRPFAPVLTEYGCPFKCEFCVMGRLGHRVRPVENVVEELNYLKRLEVRDIFFMDQTFGSQAGRAHELLSALGGFSPKFRWLCFSRVDRAGAEILPLMKRAGCHTVMFGIESADDELLKSYKKGYSWEQVEEAFAAAKQLGIRTVGTLIFGLPGDTVKSCERTIDAVKRLQCDFISVNIAAPRMGTPMRKRAVRDGLVDEGLDRMDQSGTFIAMEHGEFTAEELLRLKRLAVKEFYLNLPYVVRRFAGIKSWDQLAIEARQGYALMKNFMKKE